MEGKRIGQSLFFDDLNAAVFGSDDPPMNKIAAFRTRLRFSEN
jgi:hypothetical protein